MAVTERQSGTGMVNTRTLQPRLVLFAVIALLVVVSGCAVLVYRWAAAPVSPSDQTAVTVVIPKGRGANAIGQTLEEQGLIRSRWLFRVAVWQMGLTGKIQAGSYKLSRSMSLREIAQQLTRGTSDVWITLVEGLRNEEYAEELAKNLGAAFDADTFLALAADKQGYLFPDTYLIPKEATAGAVIALLERTFERKTDDIVQEEMAKNNGGSLMQLITLASLVQREAKTPADMRMIAGILTNRLRDGIALQVDATLQYAKGYDRARKIWWPEPLAADKTINSPYNTYKYPGLPPGPIANPGLAAIEAAANPADTPYYYYLTGADGQMHYAVTLEEHNANIQKYL